MTKSSTAFPATPSVNSGKQGALQVAKVEPVREQDLENYVLYLTRLRKFATQTLNQPDSLGYFDDAFRHYKALHKAHANGLWANPLENVDKKLLQHSLQLMRALLTLKNNMLEKKEDPILYPLAAELWRQNLQLAQEVLANSRNELGFSERERKIEALSDAIYKAAAVVKNPSDTKAGSALIDSASKMRSEVEGSFLFRRENRLWAGVAGILGFLAGFAIYMVGILTIPESMLGGIIATGIGIACMAYFGRMIYQAIWPDDCDVDGVKNEKAHCRETAASMDKFGKMIKNLPTLFAPQKKTADPDPLANKKPSLTRSASAGSLRFKNG